MRAGEITKKDTTLAFRFEKHRQLM